MRLRVLLIAAVLAIVVWGFGGAVAPKLGGPAAPHAVLAVNNTAECSENACMLVQNYARGSDWVDDVQVWDPNGSWTGTYRVLFDGYARYSKYGSGTIEFPIDYYVYPGRCIQGGIEGLVNARTPCWYAPG